MVSIRKIKANKAEVEGDYLIVETYSRKPVTFLVTFLILSISYFVYAIYAPLQAPRTIDPLGIVIIIIVAAIIAAFADGKVWREIPIGDIVEIKHYPGKEKVTVILDDERLKRNQPSKKP